MTPDFPSPFATPQLATVIRETALEALRAGEITVDRQFSSRLSKRIKSRHRAVSDWLRTQWPPGCIPEDWIAYYGARGLLHELRGPPNPPT